MTDVQTTPAPASGTPTARYDAIVIGSGFGGLYALHRLRDELGLSVRAFDGAAAVGGTWWYNRYPGARVDAPSSPFYAYTFSKDLVDEWEYTPRFYTGLVHRARSHGIGGFNLHTLLSPVGELSPALSRSRWQKIEAIDLPE